MTNLINKLRPCLSRYPQITYRIRKGKMKTVEMAILCLHGRKYLTVGQLN
jgi:hypothetical protein